MMFIASKAVICLSIGLIFVAYGNFAPTALGSDMIAGYVKNHFVREIIFGITLAIFTLGLTISARTKQDALKVALAGSIVVLPFWIAAWFGWSTAGLAEVWGEKINSDAAYMLHGGQVALFYGGLVLLMRALPPERARGDLI